MTTKKDLMIKISNILTTGKRVRVWTLEGDIVKRPSGTILLGDWNTLKWTNIKKLYKCEIEKILKELTKNEQ